MFTHNENGRSHDEPPAFENHTPKGDYYNKTAPGLKAPYDERDIDIQLACRFSGHISPSIFARTRRPDKARGGPFLLPRIDRIAVILPASWTDPPPRWFDSENGARGEGIVSLVAHVCGIKKNDAHERAAHFVHMLSESR